LHMKASDPCKIQLKTEIWMKTQICNEVLYG
jgi:hypothetical protein